jgi:hypothetical protein
MKRSLTVAVAALHADMLAHLCASVEPGVILELADHVEAGPIAVEEPQRGQIVARACDAQNGQRLGHRRSLISG